MDRNVAILFLSTNRNERGYGLKGGCFMLIPNRNEGGGGRGLKKVVALFLISNKNEGEMGKKTWSFYFYPK